MKIAVFSDLHIKESDRRISKDFARLLRDLVDEDNISDLWLLGDIFDLLIGPYKFWYDVHAGIFESLRYLRKKGVKILWCEGNHDFHLEALLDPLGIDVIDGEQTYIVGSANRKIFVAHGDLVNSDDKAYLAWREVTRNPKYRKALSMVPSFLARKYLKPWAEKISSKSRVLSSRHSIDLKDLYRKFADVKFSESFSGVFMGHCHVEDLYKTDRGFYLNLGSALDGQLRYALWDTETNAFPKVHKYPKMNA